MKQLLAVFAIAALLATPTGHLDAAEISLDCKQSDYGQACALLLRGVIKEGDVARFEKAFLDASTRRTPLFVPTVVLDSPGGSVNEALRLAEAVRGHWLGTSNRGISGQQFLCASACFVVWLGGIYREAQLRVTNPPRGIGLHRAYFSDATYNDTRANELAKTQAAAAAKMRTFLTAEDVPQQLIDDMMARPSNDIHWLTWEEFDQIGTLPAWFEEVAVRHCGYKRDLMTQTFEAERNSRQDYAALVTQLDTQDHCLNNLMVDR